jgi:hypothetical protein
MEGLIEIIKGDGSGHLTNEVGNYVRYNQCVKLKILDVEGRRLIHDFLDAILGLSLDFTGA